MGVTLAQLVNQSQTGHLMSNKNATCKELGSKPRPGNHQLCTLPL